MLVSGGILSVLGRINPPTWPSSSLCLAQTSQSAESHPARSSEGSVRWVTVAQLLFVLVGCWLCCREPSVTLVLYTQHCDPSYALHAFLRSCSFQESRVSNLLAVLILHVWQSMSAQESWCYNTCLMDLLFFSVPEQSHSHGQRGGCCGSHQGECI